MSKVHAKLEIAMARDNPKVFLNGAYCFTDGAFKRCPRFVTLSAFAYVGLLKMMVKFMHNGSLN